jgi:hypothetical protein
MSTLPGKIARVLIKDVVWLVLFFVVTQWQPLSGTPLTIRGGICVVGFLAAYSILQLAGCVRVYLASYRETIAGGSQMG